MRDFFWPYVGAFGLAVTLCSNLEGFFRLGSIARWIIDEWRQVLTDIWSFLLSFLGLSISTETAIILTGLFIFLSLVISSLIPAKYGPSRKIEEVFGPLFSRALDGELENPDNLTSPIKSFRSWGYAYSFFGLLHQVFLFGLWYILFLPFQTRIDGFFPFAYWYFVLLLLAVSHLGTIVASSFAFSRLIMDKHDRKRVFGKYEGRLDFPNMMKDQKALDHMKQVTSASVSRIFARLLNTYIFVVLLFVTEIFAIRLQDWSVINS